MAKKKKTKKIVRYRKPLNINVGVIIFALIFVYMVFCVYTYISRDKIQFYEVVEGGIVNNKEYTGIVLREEKTKYTDRAGYVNYYVGEGKRAGTGMRIYSVDDTDSLAAVLADNPQIDISQSGENLSEIKRQLASFSLAYDDDNFSSVYDAKYALEASALEYGGLNALENLDSVLDQMGVSFEQVKADEAGVVSYAVDSYESLKVADITSEIFEKKNYVKESTKAGQWIGAEKPVYKMITSELWSVIFPMTEEEAAAYSDKTSLTVSFIGRELETGAEFTTVTGADGKIYGKLDFDRYMIQLASDRFVRFEIISDNVEGLKIPISSVTSKDFYLVPVDYLAHSENGEEIGFLRQTLSDKGTTETFVPATIYYSTEDSYYIDMSEKSEFQSGDYIVKPNSEDRYQIGPSASLEGVYNINKGYAVFKQIEVLSSNDEYYTVKKGTSYGLSVYDHIVLDADTAFEGKFIYQ